MTYNNKFLVEQWELAEREKDRKEAVRWFFVLFICLLMLLGLGSLCHAYTLDQYANAIEKAEGNSNYGILKHYKHTTYRQACKNTVRHRYCLWVQSGKPGAFVSYLGASYCPVGAFNDPKGLNRNWVKNVTYYLKKGV